ncbi:hypothetical protein [Candidatus Cyanaurora vandensis]|uniref:hypothetical protein n=1 Tax=Candidatus Cyanaurora vandensis TaxID=2714958 RepID=UPI00257D6B67|nr:hypothetical protein [Candidatus Cyanaurora vandensis]
MLNYLKLTEVGTALGIVLPEELLVRLKVGQGDVVFITETPSGYLLTPYDPEVEEQLKIGRAFMDEYQETFRALAQ